jgi:hypothetical protein
MNLDCDSANACELLTRRHLEATMVQQDELAMHYNTPQNQAISLRFPIPCAQAAADELSADCRIRRFLLDSRERRIPRTRSGTPVASENVIKLAQAQAILQAAIRDYGDIARKNSDSADLIERHLLLVMTAPDDGPP